MKKQCKFLRGISIALIFLTTSAIFVGTFLPTVSAQDKKKTVAKPTVDLHTAVMSDNLEAVKQHIQAKTNLNEKEVMGGSSPLITAALFGKTASAKLLIDAGANLNYQNNDGATALHTAAFFCRVDIVKILLAKKANRNIKNKYAQTPLEMVSTPFAPVKSIYESLSKMLAPMGFNIDMAYVEKTRPAVAALLKK